VGRRLARLAVTLGAFGVAAVPLIVALLLGLQHRRLPGDVGPGSGILLVLVLVYVVWLPATLVAWVWLQDHLGLHYKYTERKRTTKRETRRIWAGMRFLAGRPTFGQGPGPRDRRAGRGPKGGSGPESGGRPHGSGSSGAGDDGAGGDR
jgi:uncharacterized membrane protein YgcG